MPPRGKTDKLILSLNDKDKYVIHCRNLQLYLELGMLLDSMPPRGKTDKLILPLNDYDKYVLHYRNLQLYLELGMVLVDIHRILEFRQTPWMKKYIDLNTKKRKEAKSAFVRSLAKLYNNSVFGKTMENVRKHRHIELLHTDERARKFASKPSYKSSNFFFFGKSDCNGIK